MQVVNLHGKGYITSNNSFGSLYGCGMVLTSRPMV